MTTSFDYAPLFRSTIGFDRVFNLLENAQRARQLNDWPPYDILKTGEETYSIALAVAGFSPDELEITFQSNLLKVSGRKQENAGNGYLHRGIAGRPFEHRFELADHVRVSSADLRNGLLTISLVREIPEALKPRKIEIRADSPALASPASVQIDAQEAA